MCAYQTNLQQGSLEDIAAEVKFLSAVWFQLSRVLHIDMMVRGVWFLSEFISA